MFRKFILATIFAITQTASVSAQTANADTIKAFKTAQKAQKLLKSGKTDKINKGIELYKQAGAQGLPSACRFLAEHYRTATPPDTAQSVHWLEILGDLGDSTAIDRLVDIYSGKLSNEGYYTNPDNEKIGEWSKVLANRGSRKGTEAYANYCLAKGDTTQAIGWLEKAADLQSMQACKALASIYASPGNNQSGERAFIYATKAADDGDKECLYLLGNMYKAGFGCEKDLNKAISTLEKCADFKDSKLIIASCKTELNGGKNDPSTFATFLEAAQNGNETAQFIVAQCYYSGDGVEQNADEGWKWMEKAAENNVAYAQYSCAMQMLSEQGNGPKDPAKAMEWLKKAAEQGMPEAQADLASAYLEGRNVEKDEKKGVEMLENAAQQGNPMAIAVLAAYYINHSTSEEDHTKGVVLLQTLAAAGDPDSQFNLGVCYMNSVGTKELVQEQKLVNDELKKMGEGKELTDLQIAAYWLEKAAEAGHPLAQQNIGLLIVQQIIPGDQQKALEYIRKASESGLAQSQYTLGMLTLTGQAGVKQNTNEGIALLKKAAEGGMPQAQNDLGLIYMQGGNGVKQNAAMGYNWLKKAAAQGHPAAMFYLSLCYASGQGTTINRPEAKKWLQKAAQQDIDSEVKKIAKDALKQF